MQMSEPTELFISSSLLLVSCYGLQEVSGNAGALLIRTAGGALENDSGNA